MKRLFSRIKIKFLKILIRLPITSEFRTRLYHNVGVRGGSFRISKDTSIIGYYSNLHFGSDAEINAGCFLLAKDKINLGDRTTLAYQVSILTSANPNGPKNKLIRIYPKMKAPVSIGHDSWVGARATILPGVKIGNYCVVAAGAVVTKDVPDYSVVAGVPAKQVKKLDPRVINDE